MQARFYTGTSFCKDKSSEVSDADWIQTCRPDVAAAIGRDVWDFVLFLTPWGRTDEWGLPPQMRPPRSRPDDEEVSTTVPPPAIPLPPPIPAPPPIPNPQPPSPPEDVFKIRVKSLGGAFGGYALS